MKPKELIKGMVYYDTVSGCHCIFSGTDGYWEDEFYFRVVRTVNRAVNIGELLTYSRVHIDDLVIGQKLGQLLYGVELG